MVRAVGICVGCGGQVVLDGGSIRCLKCAQRWPMATSGLQGGQSGSPAAPEASPKDRDTADHAKDAALTLHFADGHRHTWTPAEECAVYECICGAYGKKNLKTGVIKEMPRPRGPLTARLLSPTVGYSPLGNHPLSGASGVFVNGRVPPKPRS